MQKFPIVSNAKQVSLPLIVWNIEQWLYSNMAVLRFWTSKPNRAKYESLESVPFWFQNRTNMIRKWIRTSDFRLYPQLYWHFFCFFLFFFFFFAGLELKWGQVHNCQFTLAALNSHIFFFLHSSIRYVFFTLWSKFMFDFTACVSFVPCKNSFFQFPTDVFFGFDHFSVLTGLIAFSLQF